MSVARHRLGRFRVEIFFGIGAEFFARTWRSRSNRCFRRGRLWREPARDRPSCRRQDPGSCFRLGLRWAESRAIGCRCGLEEARRRKTSVGWRVSPLFVSSNLRETSVRTWCAESTERRFALKIGLRGDREALGRRVESFSADRGSHAICAVVNISAAREAYHGSKNSRGLRVESLEETPSPDSMAREEPVRVLSSGELRRNSAFRQSCQKYRPSFRRMISATSETNARVGDPCGKRMYGRFRWTFRVLVDTMIAQQIRLGTSPTYCDICWQLAHRFGKFRKAGHCYFAAPDFCLASSA